MFRESGDLQDGIRFAQGQLVDAFGLFRSVKMAFALADGKRAPPT
jgi:hypothetical protein